MEFQSIQDRIKSSVGSDILKRHMEAASEKKNKGQDITKRALSGGLPAPTTTERPTQALGGKPIGAFGSQVLQEGITRSALKGSSSQIKDFMDGTSPSSPGNSPQVPTFNKEQFKKDIVNRSMQKNLQERGTILAPGGKITQKSEVETDNRNIEKVNSNGVVQKGTQTGLSPMTMEDAGKLLSSGYSFGDPYSSNQLPTTNSSPYKGMSSAQIYNQETLQQFDGDVDNVRLATDLFGGKSGVEAATPGNNLSGMPAAMDAYGKGQTPENYSVGESTESGKTDWLNRSMADNSDEKVRRRSAMLDGNVGIMQAMRNQEAIQGRMYAGGKHYQVNKNKGQEGENDFVEISAGQARDRSWGNKSADEVFNNHLGKAKATASSSDSSDVPENTPAMLPDAVPHNTSMDKSPFDTSELLSGSQPFLNMESITDDDKPYVGMQKYNPFR